MTSPSNLLEELDPNRLLTQLSLGAFKAWLLRLKERCVDFSGVPQGPVPLPVFLLGGFKFIVNPEAVIGDLALPNHPVQRYLRLKGTGQILVEVPQTAALIDLYIANQGGGSLQVDFFTETGASPCSGFQKPPGPVECFTCQGQDLRYVLVKVVSTECLIWKVCFVQQQ